MGLWSLALPGVAPPAEGLQDWGIGEPPSLGRWTEMNIVRTNNN